MKKRRIKRGFTLVEIMVVIMIMAVIGTLVVPNVVKKLGKAKKDMVKPRMGVVEGAINNFYLDYERFPDESEGLRILVENISDLEGWEPYCKESQIKDPWGREFIYVPEGIVNTGSFDLISYGADGQEGGEGDNEDVYNN